MWKSFHFYFFPFIYFNSNNNLVIFSPTNPHNDPAWMKSVLNYSAKLFLYLLNCVPLLLFYFSSFLNWVLLHWLWYLMYIYNGYYFSFYFWFSNTFHYLHPHDDHVWKPEKPPLFLVEINAFVFNKNTAEIINFYKEVAARDISIIRMPILYQQRIFQLQVDY